MARLAGGVVADRAHPDGAAYHHDAVAVDEEILVLLASDSAARLGRHEIVEIVDEILSVLDVVGLAVGLDRQRVFGKA